MSIRLFLLPLFLFLWSCDWRPSEIGIDYSATVQEYNIAIGDTIILEIQPQGDNFTEIEIQDTSIVEIINRMAYDFGGQLILVGKGEGMLDIYFSYDVLVAPDSPPVSASYYIHLNVTESIPLPLNVGETFTLDFSSELSTEQLSALDSVALIVVQQNPGGAYRLEQIPDELTRFNLMGEIPGTTELIIECYDINSDLIVAVFYEINVSIRKKVFAELFTNSGCVNCPEANGYLDNISHAFGDDFVLVRYHVNWTDPFDPMNLYNPGEVESRRAYYNIFAAPGLVIDGTHVATLDEDDWTGRVGSASLADPTIYISGVDVLESVDSLHLEFDVNAFGIPHTNVTVWSIVVEDSIHFAGSNGEDLHMDVMRDMAFTSLSNLNGLITFQHSLKKPDDYGVAGPMELIVFVQSESSKSVLQARKQLLY